MYNNGTVLLQIQLSSKHIPYSKHSTNLKTFPLLIPLTKDLLSLTKSRIPSHALSIKTDGYLGIYTLEYVGNVLWML